MIMNTHIQKFNTELTRKVAFGLNDVVVKHHFGVNKATDETIQQTLEIVNTSGVGPDAETHAIVTFESIKNRQIDLLFACIQDQYSLLEVINEQLCKEHELPDKDEEAISQLSKLKVNAQSQKEANLNRVKQLQEMRLTQC